MFQIKNLKLHNTYYGLRHGESYANLSRIIVSNPAIGINKYGLTSKGREQVLNSVLNANLPSTTVIVSSDFKRTRESAEIAAALLGVRHIIFNKKLRERFMGELEGKSITYYRDIWKADMAKSRQLACKAESIYDILARLTLLLEELEQAYKNRKILLVSHGDVLKVLSAAFTTPDLTITPAHHFALGELKLLYR